MSIYQGLGLFSQRFSWLSKQENYFREKNMIAQAVYAPSHDNAASLMQPLREASQVLVKSSRANSKGKPSNSTFNTGEQTQLLASIKKAIEALDEMESDALYSTNEELVIQLDKLLVVRDIAETVLNLGKSGVAKAKARRPAHAKNLSEVELVYRSFNRFYKRLSELTDLVNHLVTTPDADEESPEYAEFLVALGTRVA
ncbi:hypothetical protein [Hymenobacter sp. YC55]|uniref:hypothetical protein n=1 Tax=Hymenobacter sp. YC55 TaxID=3034019 RepID=UPI0023F648DC|nr:hypothetical protein [Hymenobacter sp. YC55]MDF7810945.1 hypothetical protein [Hymenobacter sp. YC55]